MNSPELSLPLFIMTIIPGHSSNTIIDSQNILPCKDCILNCLMNRHCSSNYDRTARFHTKTKVHFTTAINRSSKLNHWSPWMINDYTLYRSQITTTILHVSHMLRTSAKDSPNISSSTASCSIASCSNISTIYEIYESLFLHIPLDCFIIQTKDIERYMPFTQW